YAPNDWYSHIRQDVKDVLTLIRPAKWLRKDANGATVVDRGAIEKDLVDSDWSLLFPADKYGTEKLSHKNLQAFMEEDPEGYPSQYMLNPSGYKKISFPEALLYQQTIGPEAMPQEKFATYTLWDLADTQTNQSDYTVGIVLMVDRENRGYVVNVIRDRFTFDEQCRIIAKTNHDYRPIQVIIENARGAEKLKGSMLQAARDLGDVSLPLNFVKVTNHSQAKAIRIGKLEPRLKSRLLFFLNTISCYQELIAEFRDFGSAPHDDIPDAIGLSENVLPDQKSAPIDPNAAANAQRIMDEKIRFEQLFYSSPEPEIIYVEPLVDESPGSDSASGDLWDPFSSGPTAR
ncbi:MAG: phage terminase large subunit, partial [Candidatus Dormibacteria bacterium]